MRRRNHFLGFLAAAVVLGTLPSCSEAPESRGPESKRAQGNRLESRRPKSADQNEKIELRLRLEEGKTYRLRVTLDQTVTRSWAGFERTVPQTIVLGLSHRVREIRDDGTAVVQVTYDSVRVKQNGLLGKIEYDSSNPPPADSLHPTAKLYAALVGQSYRLEVTPMGQVVSVQGADRLVARMLASIDESEPERRALIEHAVTSQFAAKPLKDTMEQLVGIYPDQPVGVGDSWSKRAVLWRPVPGVMKSTWTLISRRRGVAVLEVQATLAPHPAAAQGRESAPLEYNLRGTRSGTIELEEATGWVLRSTIDQRFWGEMTVQQGGQGEMTVPTTIEGVVRVERQ